MGKPINNDIESDNTYHFAIGAVVIILLLIVYATVVYCAFDSASERGSFGDMFGAVNTLFTGCALIGLYLNLRNQDSEINLQKDLLAATREDISTQREVEIFFKLKEEHRHFLEKIMYSQRPDIRAYKNNGLEHTLVYGHGAMSHFIAKFHDSFKAERLFVGGSKSEMLDKIKEKFDQLLGEYKFLSSGYIAYLDDLYSFIHTCTPKNKGLFQNVQRNSMTLEELHIITFYLYLNKDTSQRLTGNHDIFKHLATHDNYEYLIFRVLGIDLRKYDQ